MDDKPADIIYNISVHNDESAFNKLYRQYFSGLLSFAASIVNTEVVAEEIVEDVFVKLWEQRKKLPAIKNLSQYIYTATKNTCLNYLKSKKNRSFEEIGEHFHFSEPAGRPGEQKENVNEILLAINTLPAKCRLIFRLVKDEEMTYSDVAQLLEISERTVNAQMTIAIARVADCLKKTLPEFSVYYGKRKAK